MYFKRVQRLDCPLWMQKDIIQEIDCNIISPTGMNDKATQPPLDQILTKVQHRPEVANYIQNNYGTSNITGWALSKDLSDKIYQHYHSFLSMIDDEPKIVIKNLTSETGSFWIHSDRAQVSTMTCVIRSNDSAITQWYEPIGSQKTSKVQHNRKGASLYPGDAEMVAEIQLKPWEMILFNNHGYHGVSNLALNSARMLFTIGFLNITEAELEDIYDCWCAQQDNN